MVINADLKIKHNKKYSTELLHFAGGYSDWTYKYHHAGFDIISNRILEVLKEYMQENQPSFNSELCFWVTGHSMGGGAANLVASKLIDDYYNLGGNRDNVYCYTFAAPNTFYRTDNTYSYESRAIQGDIISGTYKEPKGSRYRCIFNIVNDDDFVPQLPMEKCEWTRYGRVGNKSLTNDIKIKYGGYTSRPIIVDGRIRRDYKSYLIDNYKTNPSQVNKVIDSLVDIYDNKHTMRADTYTFTSANYDYDVIDMLDDLKKNIPYYSKPYQKLYSINRNPANYYVQKQTPAYLMQFIANTLHTTGLTFDGKIEKDRDGNIMNGEKVNSSKFFNGQMASKFIKSKNAFIIYQGLFKVLDYPHYLESYYSLTQELNINDFR